MNGITQIIAQNQGILIMMLIALTETEKKFKKLETIQRVYAYFNVIVSKN